QVPADTRLGLPGRLVTRPAEPGPADDGRVCGHLRACSVSDSGMNMPSQSVIGALHPGDMGAAVGRCLTGGAAEVLWASEGRGPETAARARAAGLSDAGHA